MATESFDTWMEAMTSSVEDLSQSYTQTGRRDPALEALIVALHDEDPFVRYGALKAATRLMQNPLLYH